MFESKINRGKANGYAPLDGDGKVPLSKLPPIQSTIDTGSFATIGSNTFTGVQTLSGTSGSLNIGQLEFSGPYSFDIRVSGSGYSSFTSDFSSVVGAINGGYTPTSTASIFGNSLIGYPYTQDPIALIGLQRGDEEKQWLFDFSGSANFPGDINIGYPTVFGLTSGSLNVTNGNINVSGSINVSSSLVVSTTVVNNGTIDALNSDLIIDGGYLVLTGSAVPMGPTGSFGDKEGMVVFDKNFLYYCTNDYLPFTASVPAVPGFSVTASGATHTYNAENGSPWNTYYDNGPHYWLQVGPSQEGDGTSPAPIAGWYFVDDSGTIRQITSDNFWAGGNPPTPINNGLGWLCSVDGAWTYSEITNSTITLHESLPTVNPTDGTPAVEGNPGSGEIWTKTKLESTPNYAPFGSGSWNGNPSEVTQLDITKNIHLIDITDKNDDSHFYLPNGLYDGQTVRFALKGSGTNGPNSVYIWMDNLRTYMGETESNTSWSPFWDDSNNNPYFSEYRSLATALYIDGAWNIDTDWWGMY